MSSLKKNKKRWHISDTLAVLLLFIVLCINARSIKRMVVSVPTTATPHRDSPRGRESDEAKTSSASLFFFLYMAVKQQLGANINSAAGQSS